MDKNRTLFYKTDILYGIVLKWYKFIPLFVIGLFFCLMLNNAARFLNEFYGETIRPTFLDYIIYLFKGMPPYVPDPQNPIEIPILWLVPNLYIAFMIAGYPTNDMHGFGRQIILQSRSRTKWYLGKCLWGTFTVIFCYLVLYLPPFLLSVFSGSFSLRVTENDMMSGLLQGDFSRVEPTLLALHVLLLPILTSIALSMVQIFLEFLWKPIFSFTAIVCILLASVYYTTPFLIGNYSIFLRSAYVLENGIRVSTGVIVCLVLIALFIVIGTRYFKRYEILDKE